MYSPEGRTESASIQAVTSGPQEYHVFREFTSPLDTVPFSGEIPRSMSRDAARIIEELQRYAWKCVTSGTLTDAEASAYCAALGQGQQSAIDYRVQRLVANSVLRASPVRLSDTALDQR